MSKIKIRTASMNDAPPIANLLSQLGYPTSTDEMRGGLAEILSNPNYMTLVADHRNEVVGVLGAGIFPFYEKNGMHGRILALVVDEKRQGQGIGGSLVTKAEQWLKEQGARTIIVNSGNQRKDAHRFYMRLGYAETGLRFVKTLA